MYRDSEDKKLTPSDLAEILRENEFLKDNKTNQSSVSVEDQQSNSLSELAVVVEDIKSAIQHRLRGEIYDEAEGKWTCGGKRLLEDDGIQDVMSEIDTRLNRVSFLSNLDSRIVKDQCFALDTSLNELFFENFEQYFTTIDAPLATWSKIIAMIHDVVENGLNMALVGELNLKKLLFSRLERKEITGDSGGGDSGVMGMLSPFNRRR